MTAGGTAAQITVNRASRFLRWPAGKARRAGGRARRALGPARPPQCPALWPHASLRHQSSAALDHFPRVNGTLVRPFRVNVPLIAVAPPAQNMTKAAIVTERAPQ